MDTPKKAYKDTPFRYIFKEPIAFIDFYKDVFGKDLPLQSVKKFDLESPVVSRGILNDVSFLVKNEHGRDRLLVMLEHQSTINQNMPLRFLLYYNDLLRLYIKQNEIDVSREAKIHIPQPEFIVAYNGHKDHPSMDMPFGMTTPIHIIDIKYPNLANTEKTSYLAGYSYLIQTQEEMRKSFISQGMDKDNASTEAFKAAVDRCIDKGYLTGIADRREFQMVEIAYRDYGRQIFHEAHKEGRTEGRTEGLTEGHTKGIETAVEKYIIKKSFGSTSPKELSELFDIDYAFANDVYNKTVEKIKSDPQLYLKNVENAAKSVSKRF